MSKRTEQILEDQLVERLQKLGYGFVPIKDERELIANLKVQLEQHNNITLSDTEFDKVMNILNKGSVFEKAKSLRERQHIIRDNGENLYFEFINTEHWCQNRFQVTNQVTVDGTYKNRYDVTLLINGLPLVQIELKKQGLELKEAFNQTCRYIRHSYSSGSALFQYIQLYVISNGVNTKYYTNNFLKALNFKQTFYWADKENNPIKRIEPFTETFFEPCHLSKMICKYIVLNETYKILMVLRPYQYYAVEALIDRVKNTNKNGYIWHTTGSGKTLTSFKASQIIMNLPGVRKVVFVVDRKDLDYQTTKEFNSFSQGSVDGTDNTAALVKQFSDDTKLIVTTIQKLNSAITKGQFLSRMERLKNEHIVFIFDECHRSQFGETHKRIKNFFTNTQMFGFTGTPIFADNAVKKSSVKQTTADLFEECLHRYVITDAIRDENVLKFSVEYVGRFRQKESRTAIDIEVEDIDKKELMESPARLEKIVDYILANHSRKTHNQNFTGMFCVGSIDTLIKYYDIFHEKKQRGEHDLKVATIFSYGANEEDPDADGFFMDEIPDDGALPVATKYTHSREKLDEYMGHFNEMFNTNFSTHDSELFYQYNNDISKKVKERQIDLLLVVNMFLTGFDSPALSTLYVDKNLQHHGLIQAYSRTNRILDEKKSQGNIIVFRNLKQATDDAIALFSDKNAKETIIMEPYEDYAEKFITAVTALKAVVPTVDSVDGLVTEDDEVKFVQAFRDVMRLKNVLSTFSDFQWEDLPISEELFDEYKSKYLDLYDKVRFDNQKENVSALHDVDFEVELILRDEINVAYILNLLAKLKDSKPADQEKKRKEITDFLTGEANLRSKRELIEKFIDENLPHITDTDTLTEEFEKFWNGEQIHALQQIVEEEHLSKERTQTLIENYLFNQREPLPNEVLDLIEGQKPGALQRKEVRSRILGKINSFIETFIGGR